MRLDGCVYHAIIPIAIGSVAAALGATTVLPISHFRSPFRISYFLFPTSYQSFPNQIMQMHKAQVFTVLVYHDQLRNTMIPHLLQGFYG